MLRGNIERRKIKSNPRIISTYPVHVSFHTSYPSNGIVSTYHIQSYPRIASTHCVHVSCPYMNYTYQYPHIVSPYRIHISNPRIYPCIVSTFCIHVLYWYPLIVSMYRIIVLYQHIISSNWYHIHIFPVLWSRINFMLLRLWLRAKILMRLRLLPYSVLRSCIIFMRLRLQVKNLMRFQPRWLLLRLRLLPYCQQGKIFETS
jgi:hypothetical protein